MMALLTLKQTYCDRLQNQGPDVGYDTEVSETYKTNYNPSKINPMY